MNANENSYIVHYGDFKMQDWLLNADLSAGAKLTYSVLASLAGGKDHAWPSQHYLADKISVSVRTIQRYLRELVQSGLIEKCRSYLKGRVRCVYRFLAAHLSPPALQLPPKEQYDNLSPCTAKETPKAVTNTSNCREQCDNLSPSLNKEETIKRKEEIIPPAPQEEIPVSSSGDQPDGDLTGREGEILSGEKESQAWTEAKKILSTILPENSFLTWIAPLVCEFEGNTALLRCPNPFFLDWVKKHFGIELKTALASIGVESWYLDIQTAEQQKIRAKAAQKISVVHHHQTEPENLASLTLEDQFKRLYDLYPRHEKYDLGLKNFKLLAQKSNLPLIGMMIASIKRQRSNNEGWKRDQGRYVPQIHNWLSEKRWLD